MSDSKLPPVLISDDEDEDEVQKTSQSKAAQEGPDSDVESGSDKKTKSDQEDESSSEDEDDEEVSKKKAPVIEESEEDDDDSVKNDRNIVKDSDDDNDNAKEADDDDDDDSEEDEDDAKDDEGDDDDAKKGDDDKSKGDDEEDDDEDIVKDEDDDDDDDERVASQSHTIYDFDIMMAKKKEENSRKRKRRNYDIINDNDDMIADIINKMRDAVEADIEANKNKMVATGKLKLLPFVINQLRKVDLRDAFLDSDVLGVLTEWLSPLPDRSLPHLNIRESLLKILIDFNLYDVDRIKSSGIGKAIMYLYKHPKETRENKQRAKQLISSWSRPIFNLDSSFSAISREEREERDLELQKRSRQVQRSEEEGAASASKRPKDDTTAASKPGEKGWIPRARVPAPSMRDYVIRPRSKVDGDVGKGSKRPANVLEKLMKTHLDRRRANKQQRAVNMKIDKG